MGAHRTHMKILSLNVGVPREVPVHGGSIVTGIFKQPVEGPLHSANSTSTATAQPT